MRHHRIIAALLAVSICVTSISCGTLLHPSRVGQRSGPIDYRIVALDAAGLLLFFVPGVVAFAVDFYTGAIYLPPEHRADAEMDPDTIVRGQSPEVEGWTKIEIDSDDITAEQVEELIRKRTGKTIHIDRAKFQQMKNGL